MAGELPRTGQRTCFDQDGQVIEHTGTGQDGDLQSGAVWPEPRFTENGDGTVTDHLTGLMWLQDGTCLGKLSWQAAVNRGKALSGSEDMPGCTGLKVQYDDWFLPDIGQLEILFNAEEAYVHTWLEAWGFQNIQPGSYWSATTSPNPYTAWVLNFDTGEVMPVGKVEAAHVVLVRRAVQPDPAATGRESVEEIRFLDNGDGTVTDPATGLMWLKDGGCMGTADWQDALDAVKSLNRGSDGFTCLELEIDYDDWALPNRHQLRSLIDHEADLPALADGHPFVRIQPLYWSSTSGVENPKMAYDLFVGSGDLRLSRKTESRSIWPVRPVTAPVNRERVADKKQTPVYRKNQYKMRSTGDRLTVSWPAKHFTDMKDGTLLDNITGLMWLKDSLCLGRRKWGGGFVSIQGLNLNPKKLNCREYSAAYVDWQMPAFEDLAGLIEVSDEEPAAWLTVQGTVGPEPRDYWSVTENLLNLYYAWGLNFRQGTPRNYSKSFELYVWPVRRPEWQGPVTAEPVITGNNAVEKVDLQEGEKLLISVALASVSRPAEADFKIWYEDPEETIWWLSVGGQWTTKESVLYHGNLFELDPYQVFYGSTTGMAAGTYTFHFDIALDPNVQSFPLVFSSTLSLTLLPTDLQEQYLAKKRLMAKMAAGKESAAAGARN